MSKHSPGVMADSEQLALFFFLPYLHVDKKGFVKPNAFSHVKTRGRSIERDAIASNQEMLAFVSAFLANGEERVWKGVLLGRCHDVRSIEADTPDKRRAVCVYDTANRENISHVELCQTRHISEVDQPELRAELFTAFGEGVIRPPNQYRDGAVWGELAPDLQVRG